MVCSMTKSMIKNIWKKLPTSKNIRIKNLPYLLSLNLLKLWNFPGSTHDSIILYNIGKRQSCKSLIIKMAKKASGNNMKIQTCCSHSKIKYVCKNGYQLVGGDRIRSCVNGRLTGSEPQCRRKGNPFSNWHYYVYHYYYYFILIGGLAEEV